MRKILLALALLIGAALPAAAQGCGPSNPNCIVPTAPYGTSNNQAASTAFVQQALAPLPLCLTLGAFAVGTGSGVQCSTAAGSSATLNGGPVAINPTPGSTTQGITLTQTPAGTITGGTPFVFTTANALNYINVSSDSVNNGDGNELSAFAVIHKSGGSTLLGMRSAIHAEQWLTAAGNPASTEKDNVAGVFTAIAQVGYSGAGIFGLNAGVSAQATASGLGFMVGQEIDVTAQSGSTVSNIWGLVIVQSSAHVVQGSNSDAAIHFTNQAGAVGWKDIFLLDNTGGSAPLASTGTIFQTVGSWTVGSVIDVSSLTVSNYILKSANATLSGAGAAVVTNLQVNGVTNNAITFNDGTASGALFVGALFGRSTQLASLGATNLVLGANDVAAAYFDHTDQSFNLGVTGISQGLERINVAAIGATSTDGLVLQNPTAAAAGAQQWSPRLHFIAQGWKTTATAASETVDWIVENQSVQGASQPSTNLVFSFQINGGGYVAAANFNTGGFLNVATGFQVGGAAATAGNVLRGNGTGFVPAVLAFSDLSGSAACGQLPALTGDITSSGCGTTLATVATAGTTGSSTVIPVITINAKGLTTSITTAAVIAPAGTLTGTTLASNVVASSLTSVSTLTGGATGAGFTVALSTSTITGTLGGVNGGTGLNTAAIGDLIYASATTPTWSRLADVAVNSVLISGGVGVAPAWANNPRFGGNAHFSVVGGTGAGFWLDSVTSGADRFFFGSDAATPDDFRVFSVNLGANIINAVAGTTVPTSLITFSSAINAQSHITATSAGPAISACGTGSPSVSGSDNFGKVVAGTVATSCVINFGTTWGAAPSCNAASGTAIASLTVSATTTQLTITGTALGGDTITWICGSTAGLEPGDLPAANDDWPPWLSKAA